MNTFKTFMNKVGERVREVAPQGALTIVDGTDPRDTEMEGFVCPTCFVRFLSPEVLETHYSDVHLDPSANYLCPVCKARLNSQTELEMHYSANHGDKDFSNRSFEALREELIELTTTLRDERWYTEELKQEVERLQEAFKKKGDDDSDIYIHKTQLDAVEESKKLLASEVVLLRKQLGEFLELNGSLRSEKDYIERRASDFAVENAELRATLDGLHAEKVNLESQLDNAQSSTTLLESSKKAEVESLTSELSKMEEVLSSRAKELQTLHDRELDLQLDLKMKSEASSELKEEMRNLKLDFDVLKKKFQEKCDEYIALKETVSEKEINASILSYTCNDGNKLNGQEMVGESGQVTDDSKAMKEDIKKKAEEIGRLKIELHSFEKGNLHLEELTREKLKIIDDLSEELSQSQRSIRECNSRIGNLECSISEKNQQLEILNTKIEENQLLKDEVKSVKELLRNLVEESKLEKETITRLEEAVEESKSLIASKEEALLNAELTRKETLNSVNNTKVELEQCKSTLHGKLQSFEKQEAEMAKLNSVEKDLRQKLIGAFEEMKALTLAKEMFVAEKISLEKELDTITNRLLKSEEVAQSSSEKCVNQGNYIVQLEKEVRQMEDKYNHEAKEMANQITELEHRGNTFKEERDNLQKRIQNCIKENERLQQVKNAAVDETITLKECLKEEMERKEQLQNETHVLQNSLQKHEEEKSKILDSRKELNIQIERLQEECNLEKCLTNDLQAKLAAQEAEMAALAGDKLELEVKVEASSEEHRSLIERCVSAENEVERVQQQLLQLRRRLDDSSAALHDLGRENQSLQIEAVKLSERKWAEDSEVQNCSACMKSFSVTIRRHHCRNCFQIYCNDCSSKQVSIEQNKRPVRVCDACYTEVSSKS